MVAREGTSDDFRRMSFADMQGDFDFHFCFWLVDEAAEIAAASP
jgi:hypothetical protein